MGSDTTIEGAGYRGVPNPEIRCSDLHLATAEDISLGLSACDYQMLVYAALARCRSQTTLVNLLIICVWIPITSVTVYHPVA